MFLIKTWRRITGGNDEADGMGGGRKSAEQEAEEAWRVEGQTFDHQHQHAGENIGNVHDPFS